MSDIAELLERCRKATGPDQEIDHAFWLRFAPEATEAHANGRVPLPWLWLVTASIDAITALIERELPGAMRRVQDNPDNGGATAMLILPDGALRKTDAATWSLALACAFLSAKLAQVTE